MGRRASYDNNLSAIVLEKQPEESAGGDVRCCGGYLFPISTDPNVLMSTGSFGEANEDLVYGIDEYGTDASIGSLPTSTWSGPISLCGHRCAGPGIYKGLLQAAIDAEAEILYETPAYLSSPATRGRWLAWWPAPRTSPSM